jgi:Lrp/AsnC family transcriptional regulator for asnA, asnC and gidA
MLPGCWDDEPSLGGVTAIGNRNHKSSVLVADGDITPFVDAVDKLIIEQLQQDGRRPYTDVAAAVGLSEAAVRQRVKTMLNSGVMQIVAVADPLRIGLRTMAMVALRIEGDLMITAAALAAMPEIIYVVVAAGSFDLLVEVLCADHDHLLKLLNEDIRKIPGVTRTETFTYLRVVKETYSYGT